SICAMLPLANPERSGFSFGGGACPSCEQVSLPPARRAYSVRIDLKSRCGSNLRCRARKVTSSPVSPVPKSLKNQRPPFSKIPQELFLSSRKGLRHERFAKASKPARFISWGRGSERFNSSI